MEDRGGSRAGGRAGPRVDDEHSQHEEGPCSKPPPLSYVESGGGRRVRSSTVRERRAPGRTLPADVPVDRDQRRRPGDAADRGGQPRRAPRPPGDPDDPPRRRRRWTGRSAVGATRSAAARGWRPTRPVSSPGSPTGRCATDPTRPSDPAVSCPSRSPAHPTAAAAVEAFGTAIDPERVQPVLAAGRRPPRRVLRRRDRHRRGRGRAPATGRARAREPQPPRAVARRPIGCGSCSIPRSTADRAALLDGPADAARRPRDPAGRAAGRHQQPSPRPRRPSHLRPCRRGRLRHPFVGRHHRRRRTPARRPSAGPATRRATADGSSRTPSGRARPASRRMPPRTRVALGWSTTLRRGGRGVSTCDLAVTKGVALMKVDAEGAGLDESRLGWIADAPPQPLHRAGQDRRRPGGRGAWWRRRLLRELRRAGPRARRPGGRGRDLAAVLDDQADHRRGDDDAVRAGPLPTRRRGGPLDPRVEGHDRQGAGPRRRVADRSRPPATDDPRHPDPHVRDRVRLRERRSGPRRAQLARRPRPRVDGAGLR